MTTIFYTHTVLLETQKSIELFEKGLKNPQFIPSRPGHASLALTATLRTPFFLIVDAVKPIFNLVDLFFVPTFKNHKLRLLGFRICNLTFLSPLESLARIVYYVMQIFGAIIGIIVPKAGCTVWKWAEQLKVKNLQLRSNIWDGCFGDGKTVGSSGFHKFEPDGLFSYFGSKQALQMAHLGRTDQEKKDQEQALLRQLSQIFAAFEKDDATFNQKKFKEQLLVKLENRSNELDKTPEQPNPYKGAHDLLKDKQVSFSDALGKAAVSTQVLAVLFSTMESTLPNCFDTTSVFQNFFNTHQDKIHQFEKLYCEHQFLGGAVYFKLD